MGLRPRARGAPLLFIIINCNFLFVTFFKCFYLFRLCSFVHKSLFLTVLSALIYIYIYIYFSLKLTYQIFNRVDFLAYRDGLTIRIIWKLQSLLSFALHCACFEEQVRENLTLIISSLKPVVLISFLERYRNSKR